MDKKKIITLSLILGYIVLCFVITFSMPKILSLGNPSVETVLSTGKTAAIASRDIDISTVDKKVKSGQTLYISKGVGNRAIVSHKKTENAVIAKVIDVSGTTARVEVFVSDTDERWTPGVNVFQILIFILMLLTPIVIAGKNGSLNAGAFSSIGDLFSGISFPSKKNTKEGKKYGNQGSAREGHVGDLKNLSGKDGFVISKNFQLSRKSSFEHVLILGPTGAGKSSAFYIPNLLDLDGTMSVVAIDPKGEMEKITKPYLDSIGMRTICLWPLKGKENTYRFNPLSITESAEDVNALAQTILTNGGKATELQSGSSSGGSEWITMATPLFTAALLYVKRYGAKKSITEAIDIILLSSMKEFDAKFKIDKEVYKKFCIFKSSGDSEKTVASIKSVLATNIQLFTDTVIEDFTTLPLVYNAEGELVPDEKSAFLPKMLREKPTVLFISVPERKSLYAMPLVSVMFKQLFDGVLDAEGIPVFFMLDEFANIGIIPDIANTCATARSKEVGIAIAIQAVDQLSANYGDNNAQTILSNLKTRLFFPGLSGKSAEYASSLAGQTTVETKNYSSSSGTGQDFIANFMPNVSKTGTRRELITADEMRRMNENKALIIAHNLDPVFDFQNKYYEQERYKKKL